MVTGGLGGMCLNREENRGMIISKTPLRISLFGGGTDFPQWYEKHGGAVLSTAIDKYIYVIVKKRFDDKIVLHYTKTEVCDSWAEIQHDYIREALMFFPISGGIEITTLADIPSEGTGLGSSSSLAVGLIHALTYYSDWQDKYSKLGLAELACNLERDILHKPIGVQDQYIAAYGGFRYMSFDENGVHVTNAHEDKLVNRFSQEQESIKKLESRLLLFYTGITRQASDILKDQVMNMKAKEAMLFNMKLQADIGQNLIERGYIEDIGNQLDVAWRRKRQLSPLISNPEIDRMYLIATDAGAIGGKICGAGGGGFMLLYVEPGNQDSVREALKDYQELPFKFEPEGSKVVYQE